MTAAPAIPIEALEAAAKLAPQVKPVDVIERILAAAEFYREKHEIDGSITFCFRLKKSIGGIPAGYVVPLSSLHELLFHRAMPK